MSNGPSRIFLNARLACVTGSASEVIADGAVVERDGRIVFAGSAAALPRDMAASEVFDCDGRLVTPGLVDCHTHIVYAGNRAAEFEQRLLGKTYAEIARAGGGIAATVRETRATDEDDLTMGALARVDRVIAEGVTTLEVKSGYGLELASEQRMLRAARAIAERRPIRVVTSFLGAHALPPEAAGDGDAYITEVCETMLPALAAEGLVDAVDGFCETIAFSPAQINRLFDKARKLGLPVKLHADQLSNLGGGAIAARHGALSADHLEYADAESAAAMAAAGTVAVILPGAFYTLRETRRPPVEEFRRHGVRMAIATDCNPGSSPMTSLLLAMNMAATFFQMTVAECLAGVTREAARALGLGDEIGTLAPGKWCDLAIWEVEQPAELVYPIGVNSLHKRIWRGK